MKKAKTQESYNAGMSSFTEVFIEETPNNSFYPEESGTVISGISNKSVIEPKSESPLSSLSGSSLSEPSMKCQLIMKKAEAKEPYSSGTSPFAEVFIEETPKNSYYPEDSGTGYLVQKVVESMGHLLDLANQGIAGISTRKTIEPYSEVSISSHLESNPSKSSAECPLISSKVETQESYNSAFNSCASSSNIIIKDELLDSSQDSCFFKNNEADSNLDTSSSSDPIKNEPEEAGSSENKKSVFKMVSSSSNVGIKDEPGDSSFSKNMEAAV